ncbi:MAG: hypothetical protein C0444_02680 [Microbacterium sp.]|nr:hypothetical protein [Microbacterium sp.]MBA4346380.1 hypothetical protein [Microbacterium sp.]
MTSPESQPTDIVVRGRAGRWVRGLIVAGTVVVAGSWGLLADVVAAGIPSIVVSLLVLAAFGVVALCVATITMRWRTSLRFDGVSLVVRDPLGARVVPLHEGLALGRWLDARNRPVNWLLDDGRPLAPVSPDLDPVRLEAFAHRVGLAVVDLDGAPRSPGSLGRDTPG